MVPPIIARFCRRHGQPIFISAKIGTVCHRVNYDGIARFQVQLFYHVLKTENEYGIFSSLIILFLPS
jgi:hypothetical protein